MPETVRTDLRLPADLHAEVVRLAQESERSMNGQLVWLLRQALDNRTTLAPREENGQ